MLSDFARLMYVPTLKGSGEDDIPVEKFCAGLATLIPPCVIGLSVLPIGSPINPWFVGLSLIIGCFALLTPHQEYLLTRHTRRIALLDPHLHWHSINTRDGLLSNPDFSHLEYAPSTLAATYARTMNRVYDERPKARREERRYEPEPRRQRRETAPVVESSERIIRPTRIETSPLPPIEPVPRAEVRPQVREQARPQVREQEPARRQEETPKLRPQTKRQPQPQPKAKPKPTRHQGAALGAAAVAAAVTIPAVTQTTSNKRKSKKQRRKERRQAEAEAQRAQDATFAPETTEPELTPQLRDYVDDNGARCIEGIVEAVFQPGQKRTYAHVAFNPTFDRKPDVVCEIADDSTARLKSPQAFSYGTRVELTRKDNVQQREVVHLQLFAQGNPPR